MSITLYEDQRIVFEAIREGYRKKQNRPLLVAPCGFGKTVVFSAICQGAMQRGNNVTILVHRQELIDQVSETLNGFDVPHGIISPGNSRTRHGVQVASVFTLANRLSSYPAPTLLVIDEAHHAIPTSTWGRVIAAYKQARLLGVTATPIRANGVGLGAIFETMVLGPSWASLEMSGRLAPIDVYAPPTIKTDGLHTRAGEFIQSEVEAVSNKPSVTGDAIDHYLKLAPGKRAAIFCTSVKHALELSARANAAGIRAVSIDGQMDKSLRRDVVADFSKGRIQWLVTVDLISEGFDCPGIEVGIDLTPTFSLPRYLQRSGRLSRTFPGKERAILFDHAGNALRHGLPSEERVWSLNSTRPGRTSNPVGNLNVRVCPRCFAAQRSGGQTCTYCGAALPIKSRTVAGRAGTLEKLTPEQIVARRERQKIGQTKTREGLIEIGRIKGYKSPERWADYVIGGRRAKGHP